jgi:hypothetical protein
MQSMSKKCIFQFNISYKMFKMFKIIKSGYVFDTNCRAMIQIVVILILLLKKKESSFDLKRIDLQSLIGK